MTTIVDPKDFAIVLLEQLGLRLSPEVATLAVSGLEQPTFSYERVEALDADVVLLSHASDDLRRDLESMPLFATLPSVREGRYIALDTVAVAALRTPMLRGISYVLDVLVPRMEQALGH